jgi:hypothetical protein
MDWEIYKQLADDERQERAVRRHDAELQFAQAKLLALHHGFMLRRNTEAHYTLAAGNPGNWLWLWDLYPGRQRIQRGRCHPHTPRLDVKPWPWSLLDLVQVAIKLKDGQPANK